jgi:hypothetical protein
VYLHLHSICYSTVVLWTWTLCHGAGRGCLVQLFVFAQSLSFLLLTTTTTRQSMSSQYARSQEALASIKPLEKNEDSPPGVHYVVSCGIRTGIFHIEYEFYSPMSPPRALTHSAAQGEQLDITHLSLVVHGKNTRHELKQRQHMNLWPLP